MKRLVIGEAAELICRNEGEGIVGSSVLSHGSTVRRGERSQWPGELNVDGH